MHRIRIVTLLSLALLLTGPLAFGEESADSPSSDDSAKPADSDDQAKPADSGDAAKPDSKRKPADSDDQAKPDEAVPTKEETAVTPAPAAKPATTTEVTTTEVATKPPPAAAPAPPAPIIPPLRLTLGNWSVQLYGFTELDAIQDTTQGLSEVPGGTLIAKPGTSGGNHQELQFSIRNSRIGLKIGAPGFHNVQTSGIFEADFLGNEPAVQQAGNGVSGGVSEAAYFNNPSFRVRHAALIVQTPVIDILAGQYWELFGWQSNFHPNSVEVQGLPGQIYSRTAQLRLSHTFKGEWVNFDIAVAALRPPQRDSDVPDAQAGLKLTLNKWRGVSTAGSTGTATNALAIGVSGVYRKFSTPGLTGSSDASTSGSGVSIDALIPIIPATAEDRGNGLTVTGSFVTGQGIADLYSSLSGGYALPTLNPEGKAYSAPIDSGLVMFNSRNELEAVQWTSFIVGLQYYLPFGNVWLAANYSHMDTNNGTALAGAAPTAMGASTVTLKNTLYALQWADANVFWDMTPSARVGFEYARTWDIFNDSASDTSTNNRFQLSFFYIF